MAWTWQVTNKFRDPGSLNIVVEIAYADDKGAFFKEKFGAVDLTDAQIAEQARKRIQNVLEPGDAALVAITLHALPQTDLPPPPDGSKDSALFDANRALQLAARNAQLKALNDPEVDAKLAALEALEGAAVAVKA